MNKRKELLAKIKSETLDEEESRLVFIKLLIKKSIIEVIALTLLIIALIFNHRILLFSKIVSPFIFGTTISGFLLYIFSITILLILNSIELSFLILEVVSHRYVPYRAFRLDKRLDIPTFIVKCISALLFILIYITSPCTISGESMANTLHNGDRCLGINIFSGVNNGDVITFYAKDYTNDDAFYIKRVVGKEGDKMTYDIESKSLYINDEFVEYISTAEYLNMTKDINYDFGPSLDQYVIEIPKDKVLVMGDNRSNSLDSRVFGLIDYDDIYSIIYLRFYPFGEVKGL